MVIEHGSKRWMDAQAYTSHGKRFLLPASGFSSWLREADPPKAGEFAADYSAVTILCLLSSRRTKKIVFC